MKRLVTETKTCPIDGTQFEVGGRGRPKRATVFCSMTCLNVYRQRLNPHRGSSAGRPKKARATLHNPGWLYERYVVDGLGTPAIASLAGVSVQSVVFAMERQGIARRSGREAAARRWEGKPRRVVTQADMVAAYGGACSCCGETELAFLSLDHVHGGGSAERRRLGGGRKLLQSLRERGWPSDDYRVLCMNCNLATKGGRTCPHQRSAT